MRKFVALIAAFCVIFAAGVVMAQDQLVLDGDNAVTVTDIDNKVIPAKKVFGGKNTMLVFSQTACSSCRSEISFLTSAMPDFPNVNLVVAIVDMKVDPARIGHYLKAVKFEGTSLVDSSWKLAQALGVSYTPATVMINKDGAVTYRHAGYTSKDEDSLRNALKDAN